jgi:hypothetical protein
MVKTKYISLEQLKKKYNEVIEDVMKDNCEYIVMVNNEPKLRISPIDTKEGKQLMFAKEKSLKKIKEFVA